MYAWMLVLHALKKINESLYYASYCVSLGVSMHMYEVTSSYKLIGKTYKNLN